MTRILADLANLVYQVTQMDRRPGTLGMALDEARRRVALTAEIGRHDTVGMIEEKLADALTEMLAVSFARALAEPSGPPKPAAEVPAAPRAALADAQWWNGPRCLCGLPAFKGLTPGTLIHPYWNEPAADYLAEHPHNVTVAS